MPEKELIIFIVLMTLLLLVLLSGMVLFLFQYRKRKLLFEKEKAMTEKQHQLDLLNTQITIQQETMHAIGREIHDNVGQKLTLASLYCRQTTGLKNGETINLLIDDSLQELRRLSKTLSDPAQSTSTLAQLLKQEASLVNRSGICTMQINAADNFPLLAATVKQALFRILQEFIQNSLKHAACSEIRFELLSTLEHIHIIATDNGKGFNPHLHSSGIGLESMHRRAKQIEASLQLNSHPGEGTSLTIILDLSTSTHS